MLHDLVRENIVKERLKELKMLGVSASETSETQEALTLSEPKDGDISVDVNAYIILYAWKEHFYERIDEGGRKDVVRKCELRYFHNRKRVSYFQDEWEVAGPSNATQYWRIEKRLQEIKDGTYTVIQQKVNFGYNNNTEIEEVRHYGNKPDEIWKLTWMEWRKLTEH
jgi:hypothetical protein